METVDAILGSAAATKRGRLAAALQGHGPPADPVTAVLFNPTLLAKIRPVGEEEVAEARSAPSLGRALRPSLGAFRMVSKDARAAFDAACEAPLEFGAQAQDDDDWDQWGEPEGPSPAQALDWALGVLQRGRRPRAVHTWIDANAYPEKWRKATLDLLGTIPQLSGRPGEGVACLRIPTDLFTTSTLPIIATAFPNLARLELTGTSTDGGLRSGASPEALEEAASGLVLLLGGASGVSGAGPSSAEAAGGEGEGNAYGDCTAPLLPSLSALSLSGYEQLPTDLMRSLQQATQLRALELKSLWLSGSDPEGLAAAAGPGPLVELASLTQLSGLALFSCNAPLLAGFVDAFTRLTSLELTYQAGNLPPALFAPLQGLKRLHIPATHLVGPDLAGALSALTRLSVRGLTLPSQELAQPLTSIPRWRLPAGLRELGLHQGPVEVLAGLDLPAGLRFICRSIDSHFKLTSGRHTAPPVEEGGFAGTALLPAAEEALCGALRLMRQHQLLPQKWGDQQLAITFKAETRARLLQPVGGAEGTGPGRPNHGRWLREVAALKSDGFLLEGLVLSYQDVRVIGDMKSLKFLTFKTPCEFRSLSSLPLLAALPDLQALNLDATPWAGDDPESSELRGQALAAIVALGRARPARSDLELDLCSIWGLSAGDKERVRLMGLRALEELQALELDPWSCFSLMAAGLVVDVDPNTLTGSDSED
ncbi:hypothetical protein HYH03_008880 [Edaphochlamys debaryana]|uniref:Uncharacterized protein n=1 Tax=Edaphochlamys debaryana TaxID=47281 RepID=A0A836BZ33_9CHLO|nr:hypothetical protein HYH03_008880 [Edaphochlamys debaryana]|eukprot:KAG2492973.1 hypothetical protein HYH03_008880 [Edaphochlamys debaryana]